MVDWSARRIGDPSCQIPTVREIASAVEQCGHAEQFRLYSRRGFGQGVVTGGIGKLCSGRMKDTEAGLPDGIEVY